MGEWIGWIAGFVWLMVLSLRRVNVTFDLNKYLDDRRKRRNWTYSSYSTKELEKTRKKCKCKAEHVQPAKAGLYGETDVLKCSYCTKILGLDTPAMRDGWMS